MELLFLLADSCAMTCIDGSRSGKGGPRCVCNEKKSLRTVRASQRQSHIRSQKSLSCMSPPSNCRCCTCRSAGRKLQQLIFLRRTTSTASSQTLAEKVLVLSSELGRNMRKHLSACPKCRPLLDSRHWTARTMTMF